VVSGAAAFWGLRAYNNAFALAGSNALNVRNTATGETCNVPVTSAGGLGKVTGCSGSSSGDTLATFCAEDSGTCAVTELYDQTGNGNNLTQSTTGDQPTLTLNCINSLPCITFNGSQDLSVSASTMAQPVSYIGTAIRTSVNTYAGIVGSYNGEGEEFGFCNSANKGYIYASSNVCISGTMSDNRWHAIQAVIDGASSSFNWDGNSNTLSPGSFGAQATWYFGQGLTGSIAEAGVWAEAFSSTQISALCHNQYTYWSTSTAC
jgi:hypothetical protein